jgi:peptidoglycan/LPS O-acetylase OafA/YrhL
MNHAPRVAAAALLLVLASAMTLTAQQPFQEPARDPTPAVLFTILLGFGTGHFYLQDGAGLRFLLLEGGALAVSVVGMGLMMASLYSVDYYAGEFPPEYLAGLGLGLFGAVAFSAFRIWEIVDLLATVNEQRAAGKVTMRPAVELRPGGRPRRVGAQGGSRGGERVALLVGASLSY